MIYQKEIIWSREFSKYIKPQRSTRFSTRKNNIFPVVYLLVIDLPLFSFWSSGSKKMYLSYKSNQIFNEDVA